MQAATLAWAAAAGIAMCSAVFGVAVSRVFWYSDLSAKLEHAQKMNAMRNEIQQSMERTEQSLRARIKIQAQRLGDPPDTE